ncbi:PDZ domain-containing protein, partial [candidate division GN15 bacterium]|nr:PDZ domain-containing protein [candidate division GN15 bacterium]
MLTALATIFVLGVLIFFHELGHFFVAKRVGIKVERFSLGFPPNIFAKKYGDTTYCIGAIPLGGYVKMAGENPDDTVSGAPEEFMSKSPWQRALVILAGPFMNYVLAIAILMGVFYFGGAPIYDENQVIVGQLVGDGPAKAAGLEVDDQILAIDGQEINHVTEPAPLIKSQIEKPVQMTVLRGSDTVSLSVTTELKEEPNEAGGVDSVGLIGVYFLPKTVGYEEYGIGESISRGFVMAHVIVYRTADFVKQLVFGEVSAKMIGGPLFIAQQSGREARKGPSSLFTFMALLSINLAVLN